MLKTCEQCKKSFTTSHKIQKCCSFKCGRNKLMVDRIQKMCIVCSKKFEVRIKRKDAKYCSKKCHIISGCLTRKGIKNSEEVKQKLREINYGIKHPENTGENHWRWITDRNKLKKSDSRLANTQYLYWLKNVKERDGWKCKINNKDCVGRLEAHHVLNWIDYPELRYDINNGITLCHAHHPQGRAKEKRMIPEFQELLSVSKDKLCIQ